MSSEIESSQYIKELIRLTYHSGQVAAMAWSPDGNNLVSCSHDGILKLCSSSHEIKNKARFTSDKLRAGQYTSVAWSHDSQYIVSGLTTGEIGIWRANKLTRIEHGNATRGSDGSDGGIKCITWGFQNNLGEYQLAFGGENNFVYFKKFSHGKIVNQALGLGHIETIQKIAWSPDGESVVTGTQLGTIAVWKISDFNASSKSEWASEAPSSQHNISFWYMERGVTGAIDSMGHQHPTQNHTLLERHSRT